ncbi:MAG: hydrolase TatD [Thalassospira sp.]|uniref:Qat anti-phage system TatD family nuclease QatD n=1 Tax=Thalassospira sp. TaxID=1912094 RepID=UPI000C57A4EC|nr:Qat anti-phage system TatD family nuclease QatD [Thalassospira sp.]MAZ31535.1 hydrolase TatD [Thalassospira sp.]
MIDFHCHLDLYTNPIALIEECNRQRLYVLAVTTTPRAWRGSLKLVKDSERIRLALGLHPQIAHERLSELPLFEALLSEARYVGEIGLDGRNDLKAHQGAQLQALETILQLCEQVGGRPLSIHSYLAVDEVLDAMERWPGCGTPILHWFTGTRRQLDRAIALGCWFSIGPAMLKSKKGRETASLIPKHRVLTETDGPFGKVGGRQLHPWDVQLAEAQLSHTWNMPVAEVNWTIRQNLRTLTGLHDV